MVIGDYEFNRMIMDLRSYLKVDMKVAWWRIPQTARYASHKSKNEFRRLSSMVCYDPAATPIKFPVTRLKYKRKRNYRAWDFRRAEKRAKLFSAKPNQRRRGIG